MENIENTNINETEDLLEQLKEGAGDAVADVTVATNVVDDSQLEPKLMNVLIDSQTGENKILSVADEEDSDFNSKFENIVKSINESKSDDVFGNAPITEEDMLDYISSGKSDDSLMGELAKDTSLSNDAVRELLKVTNRRINKENFDLYKELPDEVKAIIDRYLMSVPGVRGAQRNIVNQIRRDVTESLIDEFISDIKMDKAKSDFAQEMEQLYHDCNSEITEAAINNIEERNKQYREAANDIEDPKKKEKLLQILDAIEEARNLTQLKEFAKTCKIKHIEFEMPQKKVFNEFLDKYKNSTNNIYSLDIAKNVLVRHLGNPVDALLFLIAFCKQVRLYKPENVLEHAYMYYVLFYCATMDGDKSGKFLENINEVITNVKIRNNITED